MKIPVYSTEPQKDPFIIIATKKAKRTYFASTKYSIKLFGEGEKRAILYVRNHIDAESTYCICMDGATKIFAITLDSLPSNVARANFDWNFLEEEDLIKELGDKSKAVFNKTLDQAKDLKNDNV